MNEKLVAIINVPVANVWTDPQLLRNKDNHLVEVNVSEWIASMEYEDKLQLSNDNLIQTQVLYGESIVIVEEAGDWSYVLIPSQPSSKDPRGYPGWIKSSQLSKTTLMNYQKKMAVVKRPMAELFHTNVNNHMKISFDTRLPVVREEQENIYVRTPEGIGCLNRNDISIISGEEDIGQQSLRSLLTYGSMFIGLQYLWGGTSGFGYDCSGFVYSLFRFCGCLIPRDASDQYMLGKENKVELNDLQIGDLLYFAKEKGDGSIYHVGINYGNGKMLHAPQTGKSIEVIRLNRTAYEQNLIGVRRWIS